MLLSGPFQGKEDTHDQDGAVKLKEKVDALLAGQKYHHEGRSGNNKCKKRCKFGVKLCLNKSTLNS